MKILIVTGGKIDLTYMRSYLEKHSFERIIAADSGLQHCEALGLIPTDILGDFDSLKARHLLEKYKELQIPILTFPCRKDFTDTHLAIQYTQDMIEESEERLESIEVVIIGGSGSRLDHTMANVGLLSEFALKGIKALLLDTNNTVRMLYGPEEIRIAKKAERPFLSVLPCSPIVKGICMRGFSYPVDNAQMRMFDSLGISNEIVDEEGVIQIEEGFLLVMESCD